MPTRISILHRHTCSPLLNVLYHLDITISILSEAGMPEQQHRENFPVLL